MTIEYFRLGKTKFAEVRSSLSESELNDIELLIQRAYSIQSEIHELRTQRGDTQIGYKVGCISETIQNSLGIYQPITGRLYKSECWETGVQLPLSQFDGLAIEGELAVRLNCPISTLANQNFELNEVISGVFPVIELHHYPPNELLTAPMMISQNAIHAGFAFDRQYLVNRQCPQELIIKINGEEVAEVCGEILRETVISSLHWLGSMLKNSDLPESLNAIVLCGSVAELFPLPEGGIVEVVADYGDSVSCVIK